MANGETVDRILRAATVLFAERGFAETSLRTITGMADVNLAAVNYHFGSKKALIQAVFAQFMRPFCGELERRLTHLEKAHSSTREQEQREIERLLRVLLESVTHATASIDQKPQRFMRLIHLAYTQTQDHLRNFLTQQFGGTHKRFISLLRETVPDLDPLAFYWRLNFCLGAAVFTLGELESINALMEKPEVDYIDLDAVVEQLVPALVGMFHSAEKLTPSL